MTSIRSLFLKHVAQTSDLSMGLEVEKANGMYIYGSNGKRYLDFNSGISVSSLGHRYPHVISRIQKQLDRHLHTMVYGEHIQTPQVEYAHLLFQATNNTFDNIYFVNSGSEAVEVGLKVAKKFTGRFEVMACKNAYHGSTMAAESLRSDMDFVSAFSPTLPGIRHISFNNKSDLDKITTKTACVILEPVQAESGVNTPKNDYLKAVRKKCNETGSLMILDEIQTGFGRTGYLFAFQKYGILPDILLIAKSMGGGMPIGAVVSKKEILQSIMLNPSLGHITTFGGHPVCTAAALGALEAMLEDDRIISSVKTKEEKIHYLLKHPIIKEIRSSGLMMAVELKKRKYLKHVVSKAIENGVLVDYFLFNDRSFRLAPPLILEESHIKEGVEKLLGAMDYAMKIYNK